MRIRRTLKLALAVALLLPLLAMGAKWVLVAVIVFVCGPALTRRRKAQAAGSVA